MPTPHLKLTSATALVETTGPKRLLFISNGYGEDSIAAEIIRRLPPGVSAEAFPTIGDGHAYRSVCPIVGPRASLASEGWRNVKGSVWRDFRSGSMMSILPAIGFGRRVRDHYDRVIVVGDIVGVAGSLLSGISNIVYLDVYKTGFGRLYSPLERWLIGRTAKLTFCRSDKLASSLRTTGLDARCVGNVMMDTITFGDYSVEARRTKTTAVALLPGSRQFTAESFALQVGALSLMAPAHRPDIFLAAAASVSVQDLARAASLSVRGPMTGEAGDGGELVGGGITVHVVRNATGNVLTAADVVLSQAGTATIQALGMGKPVLTFINPRDRRSRVRDESAVFGEARTVLPASAEAIAATLEELLADPAERGRLGDIGRSRIGGPGAINEIVAAIVA
jgi:uncharacterized protein (TIGR03492 family)